MNRAPSSLLVAGLLVGGAAVTACAVQTADPFPRDGVAGEHTGPHGDDDDGGAHGDPEAGDRVAYWDFVRTGTFGSTEATYVTRASFFDPQVLGIPEPQAEECFANAADTDPWAPFASSTAFGQPVITLDGEEWELDLASSDGFWSRELPERTWAPGDDVTLFLPGGEDGEPVQYDGAMSLPETLIGTSIELDPDVGIVVEWEGGEPANQLLLVVKGDSTGRTEYVACAPQDDGAFTIPAILFDQYPAGEVEVLLRRERVRDDWSVDEFGVGRTVGVSQVRAQFTIFSDTFGGGGGDDDDSAP